ncbi:MAG: methyltransferase domain-containing protein [Gammaproteobacteria bacterium]|nr:methyltransferase domain-containing protein [Gammaproteobacteria bacterium]
MFFKIIRILKNEGVNGILKRLSSRINMPKEIDVAEQADNTEKTDNTEHKSPTLSKFDKMTFGINLEGVGLEIGPSHSPLLPKRDGFNVEILDHANAEELKKKYAELGIDKEKLNNIEHVDYVWTGDALDELTNKHDYYDYIVASHVVEHTPDLISFLSQCEKMLKSGGVLSLAVPDKRYCFDCLRPLSTAGDVMQAYYDKRTRHTPGTIFDHFSTVAFRNGCHTWYKDDQSELVFVHSVQEAMSAVERSRASEDYIDVHNWVFIPQSFRLISYDLKTTGFINLAEEVFFNTEGFEFHVQLKKDKELDEIDRMDYTVQSLNR